MKKFNQSGFSPVETVLVLVIVGLLAFITWYVFHTNSDTRATLDNAAAYQTPIPKKSTAKTTVAAQVVTTKTDSKLGQYLAGSNGKPLYTYASDTTGVSNCSGSCLTAWPIYDASKAPTTLPDNATVITRSDGGKQYAYKGMPLYYYNSDSVGKITGDGVNSFSVAKP